MTRCIIDRSTPCLPGVRPMCKCCTKAPPKVVELGECNFSGHEAAIKDAPTLTIPLDDGLRAELAMLAKGGRRVAIFLREV